jgi:hypothetical protein
MEKHAEEGIDCMFPDGTEHGLLATTPIANFILFITIIFAATYLLNSFMTQKMTMDAIRDCSGSPSCIESTASVLLYKSTPCLDTYKYNK